MIEITIDQSAKRASIKMPEEMRQELIDTLKSLPDGDTFTLVISGDNFIVREQATPRQSGDEIFIKPHNVIGLREYIETVISAMKTTRL